MNLKTAQKQRNIV